MKTALAVMVIAVACLLLGNSSAQSMNDYKSLSGDSARAILSSLKANDSQVNEASENDSLWSWGNAPKGSVLVDGELLKDPFNTWKSFNSTESGIGQVGVDPYKGYPIYAYKDTSTGEMRYFYLDPYTKEPFYLEGYTGLEIQGTMQSNESSYKLPPVFR